MPVKKLSSYHQDFVCIIYKLADVFNLCDIDYIVEVGYEDIDNFHSGLYKVRLKGYRDGCKVKKAIVIKWHPEQAMDTFLRDSYNREFVFYRRLVPQFLNIQQNFKIIEGLKIKFPNCILASAEYGKETIAVMSLVEDGFRFHGRYDKIDLDHASLAMKNLAKLHALSFILAKSNPREFEEIKNLYHKEVQYSDPSRESKPMKCFYDASVSVVSDPVAKEKLKELGPNILSVLYKCTLPAEHYSAICHADCWNNNIFFKYKGNKPIDVVFIDYQLTRYASPVTDISYFLYMSTEKDFLSKYYEKILDIYYGTLTAVLRQCNLNIEEIYPKYIFHEHLRVYSILGLIEALISMMIITAPSEDALRMTEIKYPFSNEGLCANESQDKSWFKERVNCVVDDFFSRNYSLDAVLN